MKKYIFLSAALLLLTASCSTNDDNNNEQREETQGVRFTINEEGFGADTELTRSEVTAQPQIIDTGDCEAEISIENAPAEKQATTRSVTGPVHYTIRAYHNGALQGELKGTFTSTGFTPDAGYNTYMMLGKNRTYTFICFNDKVTPNGNNLEIALANAKDARIGRQQITLTTVDQPINLSSKHAGCRIQTKVVAQKDMPALTSTIESIGATVAQNVSYDPTMDTYTPTATATMPATTNNSSASTEPKYTASDHGKYYSYTSPAPYFYFLPGMDIANLKLNNLSGTIFWKPFDMNIAKLSTTSKQLEANGSYTIKIKMKPNYTYLMSDGTTGFFRETTYGGGTKTPIAIVLDKGKRMAMALKTAGRPTWCATDLIYYHNKLTTRTVANLSDALNGSATSGRDDTWNPSTTASGYGIKANKPFIFTSFVTAAYYDPEVTYTGTPALQWYLPSHYDYTYIFPLGFGDRTTVTQAKSYEWYGNLFYTALTQVGGDTFNYLEWTSTECQSEYGGYDGGTVNIDRTILSWSSESRNYLLEVRSFAAY